MVSLPSESDLGDYKDSEIQRWLYGMLSARGFQNRVPIDSVLSGRGQLGLGHLILAIGSLLNIPLLTKITQNNFFIGTWIQIELDELIPMSPLSGSSS